MWHAGSGEGRSERVRRKVFNFAAAASLVLCVGTVVAWATSGADGRYWCSRPVPANVPAPTGVSTRTWIAQWYLTWNRRSVQGGRIELTDRSALSPGLHDDARFNARPFVVNPTDSAVTFLGFQYLRRQAAYVTGSRWLFGYSTITVPLWFILIAAALFSGPWMYQRVVLRRNGLCCRCGHNLTGNISGVCPECGTPVAGKAGAES
jgi:hypothetical protein